MAAIRDRNRVLAAISTSTSPDSSRASTKRCTLPPERLLTGASVEDALM